MAIAPRKEPAKPAMGPTMPATTTMIFQSEILLASPMLKNE